MTLTILNFVNIQDGHIVPALAPDDEPLWIELAVDGTHMIISKDLNQILGVDWYLPNYKTGSSITPSGTQVLGSIYQGRIAEVAKLVVKELQNY